MTSPDSPTDRPGDTEPGEADAGPGNAAAAKAALEADGGELQADVTSGGEPAGPLDPATQDGPDEGDKGRLV